VSAAPIVIAAGGTGGHMFPAQALARTLSDRGRPLALVTDRRGGGFGEGWPEAQVFTVRSAAFAGRGLLARLGGLIDLGLGILQARRLLKTLAPGAVVGFGGYPSVPPLLAAAMIGRPTVIHEANAVLGRANRLLAKRASAIATAFARTLALKPAHHAKATVTGNPVRTQVLAEAETPYAPPGPGGQFSLVVFGGSQGATLFSRVVPEALIALPEALRTRLHVVQQCRMEDYAATKALYERAGIFAELASFFPDLSARVAKAHLVIGRAGASTVAEIAVIGRPAILVPYRYATDDHQTANARALSEAGGAITVDERAFTQERVTALVGEFAAAPERLAEMAENARALGRPDAAERLADLVERVAAGSAR